MCANARRIVHAVALLILCSLCGSVSCIASEDKASIEDLRPVFEIRYQDWLTARARWIQSNSLCSYTAYLPEEAEIVEMGPQVVEFIIEMFESAMQQKEWDTRLIANLRGIVLRITARYFPWDQRTDEERQGDSRTSMQMYVDWWRQGRKHTPEVFASRYNEWDKLMKENKTEEAAEVFKSMRAMGIEILPMVMRKISDGDERLVPLVSQMMHKKSEWGESPTSATVLEWWRANEDLLKFPDPPTDTSRSDDYRAAGDGSTIASRQ